MRDMRRAFVRMGGASILAATLTLTLIGCGASTSASAEQETGSAVVAQTLTEDATTDDTRAGTTASVASMRPDGVVDTTDLFTDRDLQQTVDTTDASVITVTDGQDVSITEEGVYVLRGEAAEVTVTVEADDTAKVQLVLDGVSITNTDAPAIYVKSADKVFVTTTEGSTNTLQVTGAFVADGDTNTDAVIFSKDDLTLNGLGTLVISSTGNGVTSKDDLKVTGGSYQVSATADGFEAHDSVRIAGGELAIVSGKDAIHAEDDEDDTTGYVYVCGGTLAIDAADDGIQATTYLQIDDGTLTIDAAEALEATYVQVNGGSVSIAATDDGINATYKSQSLGTPTIEVTDGEIQISMAQGDTDALDSNGNLLVSGGTIDITAQFAFDYDGTASFTGGTITVNGEQVTEITNSMMMGGGMGPGGEMGGMGPGGMGEMGGMGPGMGAQGNMQG